MITSGTVTVIITAIVDVAEFSMFNYTSQPML